MAPSGLKFFILFPLPKFSADCANLNIALICILKNKNAINDRTNEVNIIQRIYIVGVSLSKYFFGKSILKRLEKVGGQSPIDAAKFGCKIYHGPYVYNFREIYDLLEKNKISKQIFNQNELSESLIIDLEKPNKSHSRKLDLINDLGQKTLDDTMNYINKFLIENAK